MQRIAGLKEIKIVWPEEEYNDPNSQKYIISVDGADFKTREKKHPTMNIDKGQYCHKHNRGALKYEIGVDIYCSKIVWISGPHHGGKNYKTIYVIDGLKNKIPNGKMNIVDPVYDSKKDPEDH